MGTKIATLCEMFGVLGIQEKTYFPDMVHEVLPGTAQPKGGYLHGNDKPGLGIDLREDLAAKHPLVESRSGPGMTPATGVGFSPVDD